MYPVPGILPKVYMSGHNDFPEFEMDSEGTITSWERRGDQQHYVVGRKVKVVYALQEFKKPIEVRKSKSPKGRITHGKIILEIWIENG